VLSRAIAADIVAAASRDERRRRQRASPRGGEPCSTLEGPAMSRRERQRRKFQTRARPARVLFLLLGLLVTSAAIAGAVAVGWVVTVANSAPSLDTRKPIDLGQTSRVFAADGTPLGFIGADILRQTVRDKRIPKAVGEATVAVEDKRFYDHKGVDFEGIVRAAVKNLESKKDVQGGSTLTMQLVRNLYTGEKARAGLKGYKRKIREAKLAEELENRHPGRQGKAWILTKYLNSIPYGTVGGQTAVGIQAAARVFFDKPAARLKLREAALLAGLPQAPSDYNPFLNRARARARRNDVLQRMADQGYITQAQAAKAMRRSLGVRHSRYYSSRRENYFYDYVKQKLIDRYGLNTVRRGGLRVDTTIDLRLQDAARTAVDNAVAGTDRAGAIVSIDPRNGYIRAMASTAKYGDSKFNLAAQGHRQAGSTFKVMVLMAALRRGVNPNSTSYTSRPLNFTDPRYGKIDVSTYSNTYIGRANLVKATLASDNSIYQQLDLDLGPEAVTKAARDMGIVSELHSYPAEGLGGLTNGVSPLEMANAYATIASGGVRNRATGIRKVTFPGGHVDRSWGKPKRTRVFTDGVAAEATHILEQNVQAGTGTAAQIGCPAAGKTGTTDDFTDAWFVGYTPHLTSSVWIGHATDRRTLGAGSAGGVVAAPIWGAYMRTVKGSFCGGFPAPTTPFVSQPFFGRYARTGAALGPSGYSTNASGATQQERYGTAAPSGTTGYGTSTGGSATGGATGTGASGATGTGATGATGAPGTTGTGAPGATGTGATGTGTGAPGATGTGTGAQNGRYPPTAYESAPQPAPKTAPGAPGGAAAPG
jgi:penicillin-binding protein 1A